MLAELVCKADSPDWLAQRRSGIGASEIAVVLGHRKGLVDLWLDKTGRQPRPALKGEWIEWGHRLEGKIVEAFCERTGRSVRRSGELLRSSTHPWALATLDAWCDDGGEEWPLEIKNVGTHMISRWEDGAPDEYRAQVHQQMLVTGRRRATIAALLGGQRLVWQDIELDEYFARAIVAQGEEFWWKHVLADVPPDIYRDGARETREALEALYKSDNGQRTVLPLEFVDHFDKLERIKAAMSALEAEKLRLENDVRAALGEAQRGVLLDGRSFTWKTQNRRSFVVAASTSRVLRMHAGEEDNVRTQH